MNRTVTGESRNANDAAVRCFQRTDGRFGANILFPATGLFAVNKDTASQRNVVTAEMDIDGWKSLSAAILAAVAAVEEFADGR